MSAKKGSKSPGASGATRKSRNREVDDLDLAGELNLPPAADEALSPLAAAPPSKSSDEGAGNAPKTSARPGPRRSRKTASGAEPKGQVARKPAGLKTGVGAAALRSERQQRDAERERLVREALEARGRDPEELLGKGLPKGGKHRPTIELSPEDYAAINVANVMRPDLFDSTLVGFVRACARNWEQIAETLDAES